MHLLFAIALAACNAHHESPLPAEPSVALVEAPAIPEAQPPVLPVEPAWSESAAPPAIPLPVDSPPPQALYDQCKARLEGREQDGECQMDADCATAGCSQEVCVPAAKKADVITTCEILPCFGAVEACGCHEGRCTWSLRSELAPALPRIPIRISE